MDQEKRIEEEGEECGAPPKAQELLSAVQEYDKKSDPLDLSMGGRHLDEYAAAEAIKAGRKLSRLARRFAQAQKTGRPFGGMTEEEKAVLERALVDDALKGARHD